MKETDSEDEVLALRAQNDDLQMEINSLKVALNVADSKVEELKAKLAEAEYAEEAAAYEGNQDFGSW